MDRDVRMLKAMQLLLDKGSFPVNRREAAALLTLDKWIGEKITEWQEKKSEPKKTTRGKKVK